MTEEGGDRQARQPHGYLDIQPHGRLLTAVRNGNPSLGNQRKPDAGQQHGSGGWLTRKGFA